MEIIQNTMNMFNMLLDKLAIIRTFLIDNYLPSFDSDNLKDSFLDGIWFSR
ncbi:MAG: hypothetical protein ACI4GC_06875 [Acutalibacteraceae bacterium]